MPSDLRQKLQGECDANCDQEIKHLVARDETRNQQLAACEGIESTACNQVRQEVRDAAAEYVRLTGRGGGGGLPILEQDETIMLAQGTMDGVLTGQLQGYGNSVVEGVTGAVGAPGPD